MKNHVLGSRIPPAAHAELGSRTAPAAQEALEVSVAGDWLVIGSRIRPAALAELGSSSPFVALEALEEGMPVVITGLANASELNGKFGHVLGFDECSGRYKIDVIDVGLQG